MSVISIVITSNSLPHREALKSIINKVQGVFKVQDTVDLEQIKETAMYFQPEVILCVVIDEEIPVSLLNGIKNTCPQTALVLMTEQESPETVINAFKNGVDACVGFMTTPGYLVRILELVCRAGVMIFPRMIKPKFQNMINFSEQLAPQLQEKMTDREKEVFKLLLKKNSNKEIAARLFISESTVKTHVRNILQKIGVKSRSALGENYYV